MRDPGEVPCYTFGSMYRETLDVSVGREVAARCHQPHQVLELDAGFVDGIRTVLPEAVFISDGYLGMSGAAELYLNRKARSIASARITGNWGESFFEASAPLSTWFRRDTSSHQS